MAGSHYTPPLVAKTLIAQTLFAAGLAEDAWFDESPVEAIKDAQTGLRAILDAAKKHPDVRVTDEAITAQINGEIARLEYALELLARAPLPERER